MRDLPYIPILFYSDKNLVSPKLEGFVPNTARRQPDAVPVAEAVSTAAAAGARRRRDPEPCHGRCSFCSAGVMGGLAREPGRTSVGRALLHPPPSPVGDPDAVPHRHDLVLPDPLAPGGPFDLERPLEAKVMENLQPDLPASTSRSAEQYWLYLAALMRGRFRAVLLSSATSPSPSCSRAACRSR